MTFRECRTLAAWGTVLVLVLACPRAPGQAQSAVGSATGITRSVLQRTDTAVAGVLGGRVLDADTRMPVAGAAVRVVEQGRSVLTRADGTFQISRLPSRTVTLSVRRVGYAPTERTVEVSEGGTTRLEILLSPSALEIAGIVVTGTGRERGAAEVYRPVTVLDDAELRRKLSTSVAATLAGEPGISQQYNGPAASQPVIRGLGGDHVLVLEDGQRTGDIATTSADHAVSIEPLTAERIEVVRGPAGLLYGSNALGGVINVIREEVPRTVPERITGMVSSQVESVNRGITGGFAATVPAGPLALRAELSGRTAGNTQTPQGVLPTSHLDGYNGGVGASWAGERGFVGAAVRDYGIRYGVPGTFNGEVIPGGHEGGVEIELRRTALRMEGALFTGVAPFRSVKVDGNFVRFDQDEFELGGPSGPVVGTEYRQYTGTGNLIAPHEHEAGGLLVEGALGLWILGKDFSTAGSNTGSRPARQLALAGFIFEELNWRALHLEVGARYDWTRIDPLDTRPGTIGDVRTRDFGAVSASAAALYQMAPGWTAGVGLSRAFRTPSIEELFSNGPHLANYSFDIGNPDLGAEYGFGTDLFVRSSLPRINGELSVFRNAIRDYIYNAPTGGLDPRFGRFPVYQAEQSDAVLTGFEGRVQWEALRALVLDLSASYVRGTRRGDDGDVPLPMIPPLHGSVGARYDATSYFLGLSLEGAAQQSRTGEFESRSAGYSLLHAAGGIRWTAWGRLNTLTLQANNVFDTAWRDHLSRIKEVAPQPGRNLQLLYRVGF